MLHEIKVSFASLYSSTSSLQTHAWVTRGGTRPLPTEDENCHLVTVTDEEIENCVRIIPRLDTLILVKAMGHRKRFGNPFRHTPTSSSLRIRSSSNRSATAAAAAATTIFADRNMFTLQPNSTSTTTYRLPSDIERLRMFVFIVHFESWNNLCVYFSSELNGHNESDDANVPHSDSSQRMVLRVQPSRAIANSSSKRLRSESPSKTDRNIVVKENGVIP